MHHIDFTSVYVLHTRPFRETSLMVELFSETYGRVSVIARSARGQKSRYQGQLQLFTPMLAAWSGRHELKTLGQIALQGMAHHLNQKALFSGFYLNELLMRVLQKEDPHPALFSRYHDTLAQLEKGVEPEVCLRVFEKKLLEEMGFGLPFFSVQANLCYDFVREYGFLPSATGAFAGVHLLAMKEEDFSSSETLHTAKQLMRVALQPLLGAKPLNSRELFRVALLGATP